ncbi:4'-phosphopantetheinyl transferase superfamily protein [Streptacidiphilus sp. PB12-B1b]|uniref:4'-phosphopantetheinyl transferase family protein n=1 Tax=Streptacidiphilus sp. PB12-B1b TaxID=2705012 RepID=UPI0015FC08AB|nr:4'-phosphopantetheinyl transferase superfamily protein [Streptacidiphilus sp. PB12-B1b]QMU79383.1 4'-phosphopantetheinyl transferase superfamily protein [Streptacidiphilus sp. PB12-B1b]
MTGLPPGGARVWWARPADAHGSLRDLLDPVERARYETTLRPERRAAFLLGCALAKLALGECLGLAPGDVRLLRSCPNCGGPHGRVGVEGQGPDGIGLSITHAGALVGVALGDGFEVGLDVEPLSTRADVDALGPRVLGAEEWQALAELPGEQRREAFVRSWTQKEAVLKCYGVGLRTPLRALRLAPPGQPPALLAWPSRPQAPAEVRLTGIRPDREHLACLAARTDTAPAVAGGFAGHRLRAWATR